ncbi:tRNA synthetases class I (M)-domain-containing protein [Boeremia exigua]|uniref:tRNA synthetases class I (M)-domain-containing protein n=1 Tax=Boeremia exigua TaxID=749465 RepID=UPI001E8EB03B|nr:tRNA synthetases class I (M)-domain-containing protein [Boeremia exigua]KAH6612687.1 tRNA synthetases class I (M)-domain-containing protein [Boeremia exigua]
MLYNMLGYEGAKLFWLYTMATDCKQFMLQENGLIYEQKHEGWYSITDECFYPQSGVQPWIEPSTGRKIMTSIETGSEVEWSSEENYHFRLSLFRERLLEFYKANPEWIVPEHRMKDVVRAVESGLEDLSISRPYDRLTWGIRVPEDESQTIYVWLDALMNYATKAGYPFTPGKEQEGGWPADCHVIGKDIVRFHCIYWPAFLMALGLPLPKKILTHGHWTLGGAKMSKSTGRVVDPFHALDRYGSDVMRFYMAHNGGIQDDSSYDNSHIISLYNKFLNGQLGNLASRVIRGKKWSVRGAVERVGSAPAEYWTEGPGSQFWSNSLNTVASKVDGQFDEYDPRKALHQITEFVRGANAFFQDSKPWDNILEFAPGEPGEAVDRTIYLAAEALRMTGILLQPYMPKKAEMLLNQIGSKLEGVLFPPLAMMAFNWDKLSKAQRDYPKPKFALSYIDKLLKKNPGNPYLAAIVKYRVEGASSDKLTYYTQIFAQQMSAEQKIQTSQITGVADRMAEIQLGVALKQMKDAYERSESDPISVKDIRDLRFMAKMFARQGKCAELLELWQSPPAHLVPIMEKHALDISLLTVDILASAQQYKLLEKHILDLIESATSAMSEGNSVPLRQLCSSRANIWTHLIDASRELYPSDESRQKVSSVKDRVFGFDTLTLDRPLRLVRLILRNYLDESTLDDCKDFWKQFSRIPGCFTDIRRAVEKMSDEERIDFLSYIEEDIIATKPSDQDPKSKLEDWARAEICVLKFTSKETLELLIERASKISQTLPKDPDPIMIIAYCLTNISRQDAELSSTSSGTSRSLMQATMLVRAAVERDTEKENRPLALLASRLHLNLGLGRVAFQLWKHVKVKEMLVDTLSPYLLSHIALTQPFDVKHHQGFSADKELKHVVDTINRMSKIQEGLIYRDIKRFHWDSAFDLISMNAKLTSSLTRRTSILERRRIARIKGEPAGDLPDVDYRSTQSPSDNIDRAVFPAYEHSDVHRPYSILVPAGIPSADDIITQGHDRESVSKILYRDGLPINWTPASTPERTNGGTAEEHHINKNFWHPISTLLYSALNPETKVDAAHFTTLTTSLKQLRLDQESIIATTSPSKDPIDEPPMISETMLIATYSALEVLRALPRLANEIKERVVQSKAPHPMKSQVPKDWAKQIDADTKGAFDAIGKVANGYIGLLQKRGAAAFKAQVRWGKTGAALKPLISDDDVEYYAKEYVDAAVEAWKGVLQVKLK